MVGLGFNLNFYLFLGQPRRYQNFFGDYSSIRQRNSHVFNAATQPIVATLDRFTHCIQVIDVAFHDRIFGQRLNGVTLDAIHFVARVGKLHHFYGGRTDVHADQRRRFGFEKAFHGTDSTTQRNREFDFGNSHIGVFAYKLL